MEKTEIYSTRCEAFGPFHAAVRLLAELLQQHEERFGRILQNISSVPLRYTGWYKKAYPKDADPEAALPYSSTTTKATRW